MTLPPLTLRPVRSKQDRRRFLTFPWRIFADDPAWVPPLLLERGMHLDPKQNPFFQHAEVELWLAYRGDTPVGRISAQHNRASLEHRGDATGNFGFLDAIDDPEVFTALLAAAEAWLAGKGLSRVTGPFTLSINDESGLLIDGFETPPYFMMGHAKPYYRNHVEAAGYRKAVDLLAYVYAIEQDPVTESARSLLRRMDLNPSVSYRNLDKKRIVADVRAVLEIFNDAWADNWGFVPFSEAEVLQLAKDLKLLIRPEYLCIVEIDGLPAAFGLMLPNLNEVLSEIDGRLLPFGWARLLYRLKIAGLKSARLPLMGVKKRYQGTPVGGALAFAVIEKLHAVAKAQDFKELELSWVLEENASTRRIIEAGQARVHKTYRIYEKVLG
ncbi:MAG: dATP pyrophosphohydrolase [Rhodovibrionaceae bacterium]